MHIYRVYTHTHIYIHVLEPRKVYAEYSEARIDVTIIAIYPDTRLFLCDTRTTPRILPEREREREREDDSRVRWDQGEAERETTEGLLDAT